ncbi:cadmium-translocating P-type ATPase [Deinococcus sp. HMF7604]|uniref:heavy metal translocating P-type ATPase n=1 Tax=Deinococcus betulae TaxID=2873312 RepID=UPI001CC9A5F2|nr:heavy metal translocating P-type ATPase [Deinococcus betulae]MBZ9750156.1 cadmium-translocating P-type ATPase [Deinococcus betulae]
MAPLPTVPAADTSLSYMVEGMDCANCVQKVERLMATLPGAAEVKTSFARQTLDLHLNETQTSRAALEGHLRSLGYQPTLLHSAGPEQAVPLSPAPVPRPWFATAQGRLVLASGALLAAAWALSFAAPAWETAGFIAATLLGTWPLARAAWASARLGDLFSINLLVTLAALGAVAIGEAAEGAVVVFFFAIGELLEGVAAGRAREGIRALAALTPRTAQLVTSEGVREVPAETVRVGQIVQVVPGARMPVDGTVLSGLSSADESQVTGESIPVLKEAGAAVYAGSINGDGVLTVRAEREAHDNTLARILHLVEEAEASRAPTARLIERFSRVYTPGVVLVSALVAVVPPLLGAAWSEWLYRGLSLLLIGCPCALVLSVPAAITSGLSAGARRGLLVKGGAALEKLGTVKTVAFDKTGTLTVGTPQVTRLRTLSGTDDETLRLAAAIETGSAHPLGRAIVAEAARRGLQVPTAQDARALPGRAVSAVVEGRALSVASPRHAAELAPLAADLTREIEALEGQGQTVVLLLDGTAPLALLALRDEPRPDAQAAVSRLRALGVQPLMLTGDNARTGQAIASGLGLAVQAGLLPEDKLRAVQTLREQGGVAFVGDGINDAPALAQADVGVAMGGGTDVALDTADAALLRGRVSGAADLIELSRAVLGNIRVNVAIALGLKAAFLVTTLLGITNLWMAVLADTGATALVTANALRLLRWAPRARRDQW